MNEQEKQLLLKDLCARLPYGIKVCYRLSDNDKPTTETLSGHMLDYFNENSIIEVKPYLRPMESMTREEEETWEFLCSTCGYDINERYLEDGIDWLHKKHLDYRNLIRRGLALEAPKDMYK